MVIFAVLFAEIHICKRICKQKLINIIIIMYMDIQMSYIVAPCLGGHIGYITNDIAIRMLFHPHKAKYIMGWHVPFTPGIIPKEKGRIAEAIGGVISENLMNKEVLEKYLLSEDMLGKLRDAVMDFIDTQKRNGETVREFLRHYLS